MSCQTGEGAISEGGLRTFAAECKRELADAEAKHLSMSTMGEKDCGARVESDDECPVSEAEDNDLEEGFKFIDENKDGFISAAELQSLLRRFGHPESESLEKCQELIDNVDRNHDGLCDMEEFLILMRKGTFRRRSLQDRPTRKTKSRNSVLRGVLSYWKSRANPKLKKVHEGRSVKEI